MDYKKEILKQAKEIINNLYLDNLERLDISIDDQYEDTIDIDIRIEINRTASTDALSKK